MLYRAQDKGLRLCQELSSYECKGILAQRGR